VLSVLGSLLVGTVLVPIVACRLYLAWRLACGGGFHGDIPTQG
jgi:hypothetical protein